MENYGRSGLVDGCAIPLAALLLALMIIGLVGARPAGCYPNWSSPNGLSWNCDARRQESTDRTTRYTVEQQQGTIRNGQFWDGAKWIAGFGGLVGIVAIVAVQLGRTRRHKITVDGQIKAYIATAYPRARIEQRGGAKVLVDYERREIVPLQIVEQEMDAQWREV